MTFDDRPGEQWPEPSDWRATDFERYWYPVRPPSPMDPFVCGIATAYMSRLELAVEIAKKQLGVPE